MYIYVYIYMYVCMYVCMYVYAYVYSELPLNGHLSMTDTTFAPGHLYIILP